MTTTRFEVITGGGGRRRWSREDKERLVAASLEPGVTVSEVARSAGLHTSQLFRWRKQLCERTGPAPSALIPVTIAEPEAAPAFSRSNGTAPRKRIGRRQGGKIEIDLGQGRCVRVGADVDADALRRVLDVLERR